MKQKLETYYLDYFNNFLTIKRFSEYYDITEEKAEGIISIGRKLNHRKTKYYGC